MQMATQQSDLREKIRQLHAGTTEDIDRYEADDLTDNVRPVADYYADMIDSLFGEKQVRGLSMPWTSLQDRFRLRPGELTIWSGENGSGKSLILGQVMTHLISQGARGVIASLEMHPVETLVRQCAQFNRVRQQDLGERAVDEFIDHVTNSMWLYDQVGDMRPARAKALAKYCRAELKADHLVIDSLMKLGVDEGDYAGEKRLVNSLQNIAKQTGLHIHLVAHSKKPSEKGGMPDRYSVKGSGTLVDIPDNVLLVHRNRSKEKEDQPDPQLPDTWLRIDKQRHYTWEGTVPLWFSDCGEFRSLAAH